MATAGPGGVADLSETARAQAMQRFALLRPHLEEDVPLAVVARQQGLSMRTAWRWVQQYHRQGLAGLVRQGRADRGQFRGVSRDLRLLIEGLALQTPRPTKATIQRRATEVATARGWRSPSYHQVCAIVQGLDPALLTLAHQGVKMYRETYDLLYRREAARANEIWQADHTLLDLWLRDERDRPARPWLTVLIDDYSRAVAGYFLSVQAPSALHTALALRQAIGRKAVSHWPLCGIPDVFYTDHGSDFTSHHMEQVAADITMRLVFSEKGQPRGRGRIERFFETVNQLFLCRLPGYSPAGAPVATPVLTLAELDAAWLTWLLEDYHQRLHGETGMTPQARWEAGGFLPRFPESVEQLDLLLLTVATMRRVQQDGIRFHGFRYIDLTLAAYVGEDVTIRYDPRDMAELRVFHHDAFVCRAICQELAGQTISLKDIIRARRRRQRAVQGDLRTRAEVVETYLAVHQDAPSPPAPTPPDPHDPAPRLKRYFNE